MTIQFMMEIDAKEFSSVITIHPIAVSSNPHFSICIFGKGSDGVSHNFCLFGVAFQIRIKIAEESLIGSNPIFGIIIDPNRSRLEFIHSNVGANLLSFAICNFENTFICGDVNFLFCGYKDVPDDCRLKFSKIY